MTPILPKTNKKPAVWAGRGVKSGKPAIGGGKIHQRCTARAYDRLPLLKTHWGSRISRPNMGLYTHTRRSPLADQSQLHAVILGDSADTSNAPVSATYRYVSSLANLGYAFKFLRLEAHTFDFALHDGMFGSKVIGTDALSLGAANRSPCAVLRLSKLCYLHPAICFGSTRLLLLGQFP